MRSHLEKKGFTFEEPHGAIKALRAEFVVSKRTQQFADQNVGLLREFDRSHVAVKQSNFVPPFILYTFLQPDKT